MDMATTIILGHKTDRHFNSSRTQIKEGKLFSSKLIIITLQWLNPIIKTKTTTTTSLNVQLC